MSACPNCAAKNDDDSAFCEECGEALAPRCPSCSSPITPGKRFCRTCGTALTIAADSGGTEVAGELSPRPKLPSAERRVCTVLFCDLVGFTPLSETRDPEEVRELLSDYFEVARTVIHRYGGVVEKFIGDAVMAVWGTPSATEEDAERAVRAGLDLVEAVAELGHVRGIAGLAARAGLVTGPVAVTVGATGEGMVAGDAVNTAARLQAAADPGTVMVDEGTWLAARAAIEFSTAGSATLKGKAEPVPLWRAGRVISGLGGTQRIDGLEAGFVGREAELRLVKELFHACAQRQTPRLVSVTGAAGVGKSRLGWEFEKYIDGLVDTVWWHRGRCLSYGDGVAFWALAEMVRQRMQIAEEDSLSVAADKLTAGLESLLSDPGERDYVRPRLAQLLGTDGEDATTWGRDELFAGWRLFFERLSETAPVVLVVEDVQHADAGLLDFLEHLLDWARDVPIFVLTLARPDVEARRAGWGTGRGNCTALTLDALDHAAMDQLLDALVPGMPVQAKAVIADRAEGIPLYAVETVRMLIDRDVVQPIDGVYRLVGDVGELAVPPTLQSLLAARLDALSPDARRLIGDAAVLGGSFPAEALVATSDQPEPEVRRLMAELVRREVLSVRADPLSPQRGHYGFVQTMFRQVTYDTLSRRERKARHLVVAAHLQSAFADGGEEVAEVIAAHLLDALNAVPDDPDVEALRSQAVGMLIRAGQRAERTGASLTAAATYSKAASMLDDVSTPESELSAAGLHERAAAAANNGGELLMAMEHFIAAAGAYRRLGHTRAAARADTSAGGVLRRLGRLEEARALVRAALAVLKVDPDEDMVRALGELANVHAFSGDAAEADRLSADALAEAQALELPDSDMAALLTIRGIAHGMSDRSVQAVANLREAVRRAEAGHNTADAARALLNLGDVLVSSDPGAAAEAARTAIAHSRRIGNKYTAGFAVANLIQALLMTGEWDAADHIRAEAMSEKGLGAPTSPATSFSVAMLLSFSGRDAELADVLGVVEQTAGSEDPQDISAAATAHAAAAALGGDHKSAFEHARGALDQADALSLRNDALRWAWPMAADAALALGDYPEVVRLLGWLDAHRPGQIPPVLRAEWHRLKARLLAARGDQAAAAGFEQATRALRDVNSPYHLARGLLDHAEHLASHGDLQDSRGFATEAEQLARRLKAKPLLDRAHSLLDGHTAHSGVAFHEQASADGQPPMPLQPDREAATPSR